MDKLEACKLWVQRDFNNIPVSLIQKAYQEEFDNLELVNGKEVCSGCGGDDFNDLGECGNCGIIGDTETQYPYDWPCMWGTMFQPND
ncbi:unnamed protein product, partial [marine sediment metagenome]